MNDKQEIENHVRDLMKIHNLHDWNFRWLKNNQKFWRAGQCSYSKKEIALAPRFVELNEFLVVQNTILHEIAHALMPKHNHNKFWKRKFIEIGGNGKRCYDNSVRTS